jgi:hypothetical protein
MGAHCNAADAGAIAACMCLGVRCRLLTREQCSCSGQPAPESRQTVRCRSVPTSVGGTPSELATNDCVLRAWRHSCSQQMVTRITAFYCHVVADIAHQLHGRYVLGCL